MVVLYCETAMTDPMEIAKGIKKGIDEAGMKEKPVTVSFVGGEKSEAAMQWLVQNGVPAYGAPDLAVQVNGLDVAMHDPRAFTGQALAYVTSPRGACHNQSDFFTVELGGTMDEIGLGMTDRAASAGKAAAVARHQHWRSLCNDLVICFFTVIAPQEVADLLSAATGADWSVADLLKAGERAWNLKRCYNLRLGLTPAAEKLPKLLLEPLPEGGQAGVVPDMRTLLAEYYAASGWNPSTGWPTPEKLAELGLEFI
jgi:aldehyde:ferredoxin oxidoreductase